MSERMSENFIHETLNHQMPDRQELTSSKDQELDRDFIESGESNLAVDFDELLKSESNYEQMVKETANISDLSNKIKFLLDKGLIEKTWQAAEERIKRETNFFHDYQEIEALADKIDAESNPIRVEWGAKPTSRLKGGFGGEYNRKEHLIKIYSNESTPHSLLSHLALFGMVDTSQETYHHELTHSFQYYGPSIENNIISLKLSFKQKILSLLQNYCYQNTEIKEAHAYREDKLSTNKSIVDLVEELQSSPDLYPNLNIYKLIYAIQAIDKLRALDFPKEEIARLVKESKWDKQNKTYSSLQESIERRIKDLHLSEEDLENLVMADRIERNIQRLKSVLIAREEMNRQIQEEQLEDNGSSDL